MRKDPENENQKEIELCRCSFGCHFKSDSTIEQDEKEQIESGEEVVHSKSNSCSGIRD
jgi:hypothetical protein